MNDNENKTNAPIKLPELLPCPMCNGDAEVAGYVSCDCCGKAYNGRVRCRKCPAAVTHLDSDADAVTAWNTRNEADALRAEVDDLAMFVRRFLGSKFVPHCALAVKATDYLQRKGLQGSLLRDAAIKPNAAAGETSDAREQGGDAR